MTITLCEIQDASAWGLESFSPFCLKVHRALKAAGIPYVRKLASQPAEHAAHNPLGQVPVLLVDEQAIPDSSAILQWIVETAPGTLMATPEAWLWEELADTSVNGFLVAARWADERNWPITKKAYFAGMPLPLQWFVPGRLRASVVERLVAREVWRGGPEACWRRFEKLLDHLEGRAPLHGFWMGPQLSVADVSLFGQLHGLRTQVTVPQAEMLKTRRTLSAWLDRVNQATEGTVSPA